jgi:hypothetical protein
MGEVGPSVNRILKNESSSDQKTSSGSVSLSEGQVMVLESVSADQVTSSFLHSSESHDDSKDSGGLESQIQKSLKSPDVSIDEHSMSQIQSTSINISMIAPEEKP